MAFLSLSILIRLKYSSNVALSFSFCLALSSTCTLSGVGGEGGEKGGVGTCGKEGQSVPVGVGQPTLKIDNIIVGGTGQ